MPIDSKRHKSANHPAASANNQDAYLQSFTANDTPSQSRSSSLVDRPSRFQEASMHDRPSEKPPSVFTRVFNGRANQSMDKMMEEYMDTQKEPPRPDTARTASRATQLSGLTHHPNTSISSSATLAMSTDSRQSGVFRFGRTIASSINPAHIWQKVTTWRDGKTEHGDDEDEMVQRQIRAEQTYAELKKAGQLGALGSRPGSRHVFAPGYNDAVDDLSKQRDSGISMTSFDTASSNAPPVRISAVPGSVKKKASFGHFRTPSLQNLRNPLKKMASEANLHRRTASESITPSKQPITAEPTPLLRPSSSRKDLLKQAKLSRRVSDLEVKLETARRELDFVRSNTPGVPPLSDSRPVSRSNILRRFAPLPTLPSESLLIPEEMSRPNTAIPKEESSRPTTAIKRDHSELSMLDSEPNSVRQINDVEMLPPPPPIKDPVSVFESSSAEPSPENALRRAFKKRKPPAVDSTSRFNKDDNDVMELDPPTPKLRKTRSPSKAPAAPTNSPKSTRSSLPKAKPKVLTKPHPSIVLKNMSVDVRGSLETVQEESYVSVATTTKLPLNESPVRPTAMATPAHPRMPKHRHVRSMSPIKTPRVPLGDTSGMDQVFISHYRTRSSSPASCATPSSRLNSPTKENDSPVRLRPNGLDVPPLPMPMSSHGFEAEKQSRKEDWEWPDDVF
jgi:hypothetical protein